MRTVVSTTEIRTGFTLNCGPLTKSEVVFETEIYAPLQKLCALKSGVLDPTIFDNPFQHQHQFQRPRVLT